MNEEKCECGHQNRHGTILCEACGRLLDEKQQDSKLIDMRYEGSARRSQTYNKKLVDKIWNFFSSVKVGISLIVILLVASAVGTIFPQEMYIPNTEAPEVFYEQEYGWLGQIYYLLGFHNLYSSWWYLILIALLGTSLLIASLDRVVPLHRSLKNQKISRHEGFLKRQRLFGISQTENLEADFTELKKNLLAKKYKIREENGNLLAEKGRFSRWGPYINHAGLIIFLLGAMLRYVPGMYVDEVVWLREGETKALPGTEGQYYLKNEAFILEVYDKENEEDQRFIEAIDKSGMIAKNFQTNVTLYEQAENTLPGEDGELIKIRDDQIKVNEPLKHDHYALYQVDYKLDELKSMSFDLVNQTTSESFGSLTIDLDNPKQLYDLGAGYSVELMSYFPDFELDENGEPTTKSRIPNNPAFIFNMITPDKSEGEVSFVAIQQTLEPLGENTYKMAFQGVETRNVTGLTVRKDLTLWILFLGGGIFMIGVIQGAYWNHRRIWIQRKEGDIWLAGHTNKNLHGLKRDIHAIIEGTQIKEPNDQLEEANSAK
jgi:cytochrome c biogenesis protein